MKKYVWLLGIIISSSQGFSQGLLKLVVKDSANKEPVAESSVVINKTGRTTANDGSAFFPSLPNGNYAVTVTAVGFIPKYLFIALPDTSVHTIYLARKTAVLQDVTVIATTRSNQPIENSPLKVEVLGKEEMDEENSIHPSNIVSVLGDISGVQ